jgi:hypothetical protein
MIFSREVVISIEKLYEIFKNKLKTSHDTLSNPGIKKITSR